MDKQSSLCLRENTTLINNADRIGLLNCGKSRMARSSHQSFILQQLADGSKSLEALKQALCIKNSLSPENPEVSLAIAGFILDFTDFLEN